MACYDTIVGLSQNDCPCIETAPPDGYNTSDSGLYLDELEPLTQLQGYENCGTGSVWDLLERARTMAISTFKSDTNSLLTQYWEPKRQHFSGQIGEAKGSTFLSTSDTYAGMRIRCNPMRSGTLRIKRIGTLFSGSGTITLSVYNSLNTLITTRTLTVSNGFTVNDITDIELPLYVDFDDNHEYYLIYSYNEANKPRLNNINCGCGGFKPWFDVQRPMWSKPYTGGAAWANWIMVSGWTGSALDFTESPGTATTQLNGLFLDVDLGCSIGDVICKSNLDFTLDPLALTIAHAIRFKASYYLGQSILGSSNLNRQSVINREELKARMAEWSEQYTQSINYIVQNAKIDNSDCLTCRNKSGLAVKSILA